MEYNMSKHLQRDLEHLKKEVLSIASLVEAALSKAILALIDRRSELAEEIIQADRLIDEKEVLVEEECLKILALHQPVAGDLRFIISVLKVTNDLERMGDLCVNIAERASYLSVHSPLDISLDFPSMTRGVQRMVRNSLDSLTTLDTKLARDVLAQDDEIDAANREMFNALQELMHQDNQTIERAVHMLSASRHLERIADLATNIVQDVVYMVDGELIRHRHEEYFDSLTTK
jgi:phosphate transport system protein